MQQPAITDVDLFITENCNLDCKYCFHPKNRNSLDMEQAKKILDKLAVIAPGKMRINYWGGEPMLHPNVVIGVAEYAQNLWSKSNLSFHLVTNGTIYTNEIFKKMKELKISVQVSLDGAPETNDAQRSKGELVAENIKKILVNFPETSVRMTFTPDNVHKLVENIMFIKGLGVKKIMHQAVIEADWDEESIKKFAEQSETLHRIKAKNPDLGVMFVDKNTAICDDMQRIDLSYCGAGRQLIAILPNGDVYACHRAASNRIMKLGNILTDKRIIRGMFLNIDKSSTGCINCEAWKTCHTCLVTHYQVNGRLEKFIPNYCKLMFVENALAQRYLPIIKQEEQRRQIKAIGNVVLDLSSQLHGIHKQIEELGKKLKTNTVEVLE